MYSGLEDRNIYAGENVFYRYGHKAQERMASYATEHNGWISVPVNGGKYYAIGTSNGKFGEFANLFGTCYSVNRAGYAYAKAGTEKGDKLVEAINHMVENMRETNNARGADADDREE